MKPSKNLTRRNAGRPTKRDQQVRIVPTVAVLLLQDLQRAVASTLLLAVKSQIGRVGHPSHDRRAIAHAGVNNFFDEVRSTTQSIILSDTILQFASPMMWQGGWPTLFCSRVKDDRIVDYHLRQPERKRKSVLRLKIHSTTPKRRT